MDLYDLFYFGVHNILYATYLELHPGLGNIILRSDSNGIKRINLMSYLKFIGQPLKYKEPQLMELFWNPKNLDMNYIFTTTVSMLGYFTLRCAYLSYF
tara:strand:+ start:95 stop:388 length:294 start_codon:yes stop_codon:yes gene_type:complete